MGRRRTGRCRGHNGKGQNAMLHITICDDEKTQLTLLETWIREWARDRKWETEIHLYGSAEQFLFEWEEKREADVALLDIDMPGMNGICLARRLREKGEDVQIIFVTGLADYVLEGYDVEAVSYLIKPVKKERLFTCLDRAWERCGRRESALLLETAGGLVRVRLKDVCYLESDGHDTRVHCAGRAGAGGQGSAGGCRQGPGADGFSSGQMAQAVRSKSGIHELEERFKQESNAFFRIHRSYLVNLSCVSRITRKEVQMDTGETLPVARGRWEALNRAYLDYYRGRQEQGGT